MYLNADNSRRVVLDHNDLDGAGSPPSVQARRLRERTNFEVAKAASIAGCQAAS